MSGVKILIFHKIFYENAKILSQRSNFELIQGDYKPVNGDLLIIYGANEKPVEILQLLNNFDKMVVVIMQSEQLESRFFENKFYLSLLKHQRSYVFDWSEYNATKLKLKYNIKPISLFSFDFYGKEPYPKLEDRPIDIFFCGGITTKRQKIINDLKERYPNYKYFIDFHYSLVEPNKMVEVLKKCKIVLNISAYEKSVLETHRIVNAKSCGCEVVSEYSECNDLNNSYEHFVHFTTDFIKTLKDINNIIKKPKKTHEEWNRIINKHTLADNVDKMKKIISLHYNIDEKK